MTLVYFINMLLYHKILFEICCLSKINKWLSLYNSLLSLLIIMVENQRRFFMIQVLESSILKALDLTALFIEICWFFFYLAFFQFKDKTLSLFLFELTVIILKLVYQHCLDLPILLLLFCLQLFFCLLVTLLHSLGLLNAFVELIYLP